MDLTELGLELRDVLRTGDETRRMELIAALRTLLPGVTDETAQELALRSAADALDRS